MRKIDVLVAVNPEPLLRLIEHLLHRPEFRIVKSLSEWPNLPRDAGRFQPHLIIINAQLLGYEAGRIIAAVKVASPSSKLIVISFPHDLSQQARKWGADAYLEEEQLVQRLVPTAHKLFRQEPPTLSKSRKLRSRSEGQATDRASRTSSKTDQFC